MSLRRSSFLWGVLLIGAGAVALAQQFGLMRQLPEQVWIWVFALISVVGFASYALSGWKEWGWLFPAGIFGGLAVTVGLAIANVNDPAVSSSLFFGLLLPFVAAYFTDRSRNWWALIPGAFMLFLALVTLLVDSVGGEWIGSLFLFMLAAGFFMAYLSNRARMWALLVAYIIAILGIAPLIASSEQGGGYYGALFLLAVALPFLFVYFRGGGWWALIPASVFVALSLITAAAVAGWINSATRGGYVSALLMGALAVAFAVIWLRHAKPWARIVTIVLGGLALASILFAAQSEILWPVAIMLVGIYVLFTALRRKAT